MKGQNLQALTFCTAVSPTMQVGFSVYECNNYEDKRIPSLYDMRKIAWEVSSKPRGKVGFKEGVPDGSAFEVKISPPKKTRDPLDDY